METMKAIVIYEAGGPEKLLLEERPIPELQEGWTLVKYQLMRILSRLFRKQTVSISLQLELLIMLAMLLSVCWKS